jgi:hypothetical protein
MVIALVRSRQGPPADEHKTRAWAFNRALITPRWSAVRPLDGAVDGGAGDGEQLG